MWQNNMKMCGSQNYKAGTDGDNKQAYQAPPRTEIMLNIFLPSSSGPWFPEKEVQVIETSKEEVKWSSFIDLYIAITTSRLIELNVNNSYKILGNLTAFS
eukprot:Tbor_TRINITY_DN6117_c0_g5::TRINITY_DN6117_c0_g5_i1::g.22079::m.22079